jgi:hypothetical protein
MSNNKRVNKRLESTKEYIDTLQDKYSKLCVVRVDFGYKKPHSDSIVLDDANKDLERMMNNRRGKPSVFRALVGYVHKKEFSKDKGVHIHGLLLYDGQAIQKDAFKAQQLCKHWDEDITKGKGSSHNCNRNAYERKGIGMLEHSDKEKRKILDDNVLSYLCKDDYQDIAPVKGNKNSRAFVRGTLPKTGQNKIGRPRDKKF